MGAQPLRVVTAEEAPDVPKSVTVAAADGSRLELLVAMRARVATAVEDPKTPARDLAALTRRLLEIAKEIEALESVAGEAQHVEPADDTFDPAAV